MNTIRIDEAAADVFLSNHPEKGQSFTFRNTEAESLKITPAPGETINGALDPVVIGFGGSAVFVRDGDGRGDNWTVIAAAGDVRTVRTVQLLTAATITDAQIRELRCSCDDPTIELMCRTALGTVTRNGTPLPREIIDEARADCAEVLNRRAMDPLPALRELVEALDAVDAAMPSDPRVRQARARGAEILKTRER